MGLADILKPIPILNKLIIDHGYRLFQFYRYNRYQYFSVTDTDNQPIPIYLAFTDNRYRYRYFHRTDTDNYCVTKRKRLREYMLIYA